MSDTEESKCSISVCAEKCKARHRTGASQVQGGSSCATMTCRLSASDKNRLMCLRQNLLAGLYLTSLFLC